MELRDTPTLLREERDAARHQLVSIELNLAITFCQVAATTRNPSRRDRNIAQAQEARGAAVHFLNYNPLERKIYGEINEKLRRLNSLLAKF